MKDTDITVQSIVARCGGATALAGRLPVSAWAIYKWCSKGHIPFEYWDEVMTASGATLEEMYHANRLAKTRDAAEVAA